MSTPDASSPSTDPIAARRDALVARLEAAGTDLVELCTLYLGERLGFYDALAAGEALTSTELATRTETNERYTREWLEQQATAGILHVDDPDAAPRERRFVLPVGHAEVLGDRLSDTYWGAGVRFLVGLTRPLPAVLEAFRTGGGVPFAAYGADLREGLADGSRLGSRWFINEAVPAALPDVHARLQTDPPARVADLGCGAGWASIAIARAYPKTTVDGFDLDAASVELASRNVVEAGVQDRVHIAQRDAADPALAGSYDLVLAIAVVHDTPQPVAMLQTMRRLAGDEGVVLVSEPKSGERFLDAANNGEVERSHFAFSVLHCLPVGMAEQPSAGTGTMMRPDILRGYARDAGFHDVEVLSIDDPWTAAYRLRV
jgi:2-polyprenyl-3-methyl-5-hydroxy-6-metoxy-1,4-benzoquinol methylase